MPMTKKDMLALGAGAVLLVGVTAGASAYYMQSGDSDAVKTSQRVSHIQPASGSAQPIQTCDDDNIVGKVLGGAAGGVAGSQLGKGNGKTAATIGGAVGGSLLGEEYIPTKNATCR